MAPHALRDPDSPMATSPVDPPAFSSSRPPSDHVSAHTSYANEASLSHLAHQDSDEPYDLVGVGFGPANLALAIALHDALDARKPIPGLDHIRHRKPRVLFLERQPRFAWHEGMLLPGTKMQISFVKDLATLRDPRSNFTFLNYLHNNDRLVQFTNLDTFLPQRIEYQAYMKWCAGHFSDVVSYGKEVTSISPLSAKSGPANAFGITMRDVVNGRESTIRARHTVIAIGGKPNIPRSLPQDHSRVLHSSRYALRIHSALPDTHAAYRIAVIGGGQSAAEVFNDLHSRYPNSQTRLILKGAALKPSDDSPFVNEIFDPERVDKFYTQPIEQRTKMLLEDKATNYGVVRISLLEHIYETLYTQRIKQPDESQWQHRVLPLTAVVDTDVQADGIRLHLSNTQGAAANSTLDVDAIIVAAGYMRDVHETMLEPCRKLMSAKSQASGKCEVQRDYSVAFETDALDRSAGVWLQGCNEGTHGLSDTLLSILATRGGEMVKSIFGDKVYA